MSNIIPKNIFVNKLKIYHEQCKIILEILKLFESGQEEREKLKTNMLYACMEQLIEELNEYIEDHNTFQYSIYS